MSKPILIFNILYIFISTKLQYLLPDINECASNPCENGGNCTDGENNYYCYCVTGYSGKNCETSKFHCFEIRNGVICHYNHYNIHSTLN